MPSQVTPADWLNDWGTLETHVLVPLVAAVVNKSGVLLSCDEAKSLGTDRGPCLSISVIMLWMFLPSGPVTHSSTAHWHCVDLLSQACLTYPGTDEHLIRGSPRDWDPSLYGCLNTCVGCNLDKLMQTWFEYMQRRTYMFVTHTHTRFTLSLSASGACMVASWWVQLEFHTQLGSSCNGDWHVPAIPLHTAATVDVYILDQFCIITKGWWQMTEKKIFNDLCVALSKTGHAAWVIRYIDVQLLFCYFVFNDNISVIYAESEGIGCVVGWFWNITLGFWAGDGQFSLLLKFETLID